MTEKCFSGVAVTALDEDAPGELEKVGDRTLVSISVREAERWSRTTEEGNQKLVSSQKPREGRVSRRKGWMAVSATAERSRRARARDDPWDF